MNSPRFYCREALSPGAHVELPEPVARHAVRVLRLPPGAPMVLFDGRGGEYPAHIERIERDRVYAELAEWRDIERESRLNITLVQALQAGDKMDFTIQKAVELGVRDIVPVESRRSVLRLAGERAGKRVQLWLEPKDAKRIDNLKKLWSLPSRAAVIQKLLDRAFGG